MLPSLLLAASLATVPAPAAASAPRVDLALAPLVAGPPSPRGAGPGRGLRQEAWEQDQWDEDHPEQDERHPHLLLSLWGGEAFANGGSGRSSGFFAAEAAWAFSSFDVGLEGARYRSLREASQLWTPVVLTRFTQRFMTHRGVEYAFTLGFGAGKPSGWIWWYQVALGVRVPLGPVFIAGELAFEQYQIIRLGGGLGFAF